MKKHTVFIFSFFLVLTNSALWAGHFSALARFSHHLDTDHQLLSYLLQQLLLRFRAFPVLLSSSAKAASFFATTSAGAFSMNDALLSSWRFCRSPRLFTHFFFNPRNSFATSIRSLGARKLQFPCRRLLPRVQEPRHRQREEFPPLPVPLYNIHTI